MGKRWLTSLGCLGMSIVVFAVVRWWGMYWYFGAAGAMSCSLWYLAWYTFCIVFMPRSLRRALYGDGRRVRRVILEEEVL